MVVRLVIILISVRGGRVFECWLSFVGLVACIAATAEEFGGDLLQAAAEGWHGCRLISVYGTVGMNDQTMNKCFDFHSVIGFGVEE